MRKNFLLALLLFLGNTSMFAQHLSPHYIRHTVRGHINYNPNPLEHFLKLKTLPGTIDSSHSVQLIKYIADQIRDTIFSPDFFISNYLDSSTYSAEGFFWNLGTVIPHFPAVYETAILKKIEENHYEVLKYNSASQYFDENLPNSLKLKYNSSGQLITAKLLYTRPLELNKTTKKKNKPTTTIWQYEYNGVHIKKIKDNHYTTLYDYDPSDNLVSIISCSDASPYLTAWLCADSLEALRARNYKNYEIQPLLDKGESHIYFAAFYKYSEGKPTQVIFYEAGQGDAIIKKKLTYDSLQRLSVFDEGRHTRIFYEYDTLSGRLSKRKVISYSDWGQMQNPTSMAEESYFYNHRGFIKLIEKRNYVYLNGSLKRMYEDKEQGLLFKYK